VSATYTVVLSMRDVDSLDGEVRYPHSADVRDGYTPAQIKASKADCLQECRNFVLRSQTHLEQSEPDGERRTWRIENETGKTIESGA
jgi:hypothetical protein